jgi:hypothetical protein
MSKRPARPKIVEGFDLDTGLPTPEQAKQTIQTTVAKSNKTFTLQDAENAQERKPGLTNKGRAKFTTMLKPELRQKLQSIATNRQISVADVIETMITEYLGLQ